MDNDVSDTGVNNNGKVMPYIPQYPKMIINFAGVVDTDIIDPSV
jgi:hypothetical protein